MLSASVHLLKSKRSSEGAVGGVKVEEGAGDPVTAFHFECHVVLHFTCVVFVVVWFFFSEAHLKNDLFCSS